MTVQSLMDLLKKRDPKSQIILQFGRDPHNICETVGILDGYYEAQNNSFARSTVELPLGPGLEGSEQAVMLGTFSWGWDAGKLKTWVDFPDDRPN